MDNGEIQKLAAQGLDDLALSNADVESRGTNPGIVESASETLTTESNEINSFIAELEDTKSQLLANWEGESAEKFASKFPQLIEAFGQIPKCVSSIAEWAKEVSDGYVKIDQASF